VSYILLLRCAIDGFFRRDLDRLNVDSNNHTHFQDFRYKIQQYAGQVAMGERGEEYGVDGKRYSLHLILFAKLQGEMAV